MTLHIFPKLLQAPSFSPDAHGTSTLYQFQMSENIFYDVILHLLRAPVSQHTLVLCVSFWRFIHQYIHMNVFYLPEYWRFCVGLFSFYDAITHMSCCPRATDGKSCICVFSFCGSHLCNGSDTKKWLSSLIKLIDSFRFHLSKGGCREESNYVMSTVARS